MKRIKLFEDFNEEQRPVKRPEHENTFDPAELTGDDKKVFEAVETLCQTFYSYDNISQSFERKEMEPIITTIIDQTARGHKFPRDKQYFVFVNNFSGKGYVEIECGIDRGGNELYTENAELSSHGYPASYGEDVYTFDTRTGEIKYDKEFFKYLL